MSLAIILNFSPKASRLSGATDVDIAQDPSKLNRVEETDMSRRLLRKSSAPRLGSKVVLVHLTGHLVRIDLRAVGEKELDAAELKVGDLIVDVCELAERNVDEFVSVLVSVEGIDTSCCESLGLRGSCCGGCEGRDRGCEGGDETHASEEVDIKLIICIEVVYKRLLIHLDTEDGESLYALGQL